MKFIIDIPEKDVQGCYNCPFNYDFIACVAPNGPGYVDIDDYLGNSFITTRPEGCPLIPVVPDQEEMDRNNSEQMSDELLPCPFCGGEAEIVHTPKVIPYEPWWIRCSFCEATTPKYKSETAKADAIAAWNRRAEHD